MWMDTQLMCPKWSLFFRSWIVYCSTVQSVWLRKVLWKKYNLYQFVKTVLVALRWPCSGMLTLFGQDCDEAVPPASPGAESTLVEEAPVGNGLPAMCGRQVGVSGRTFHSKWIELTHSYSFGLCALFDCRPHELDFSEQAQTAKTFGFLSQSTLICADLS